MTPARIARGPIAWYQRLDARMAASLMLIAGLALTAILVAAGHVITAQSFERSRDDLIAARKTFDHLVTTRATAAHAQTRLVVDLPIFRAMLTLEPSNPVESQTITDTADKYCQMLGASFCVVRDQAGRQLGHSGELPASQTAVEVVTRSVEAAVQGRPTTELAATDAALFLVVSEPAQFAKEVLGVFTVAFQLDDAVARELSVITHCDVSFMCGARICGTSLDSPTRTALAGLVGSGPSGLGAVDEAPAMRSVGGRPYVGGVYAFASPSAARLVLLQDWTPTERAVGQLNLAMAGIGGIVLLVTLGATVFFSRYITKPLRELVTAADTIAGGESNRTVTVKAVAEVGTLVDAFNHMTSTITHWHDQAELRATRLSETYEWLRSMSDSTTDAIISMNTAGEIIFWNGRAEAIFGYAEADALRRPLTMLLPPRHVPAYQQAIVRLGSAAQQDVSPAPTGPGDVIELQGLARDGREVPIELSLSTWTSNGAIQYTAVIRDITERLQAAEALRQRETELRQAQKMEAIGRLAGGVAHDFNNLLTAILGYSDLLLETLPANDPMRRQLTGIQQAGQSAASLTRHLLAFSRKQVLQPVALDLNAIVSRSDQLLRRLIGEDIELTISLEPSIATVKADPAQVEQLLMNLAVNARDAMPAGGRLSISTINIGLDAMRLHVPTASGPSGAIVVSDTGVGMSDAVRARIFEPFFTTKEPGQGTGLGLASVYGAVKQVGGHVWVDSAPGRGSAFTVSFPAVSESPALSPVPAANRDDHRGTETVLLVEDNDAVRALAREALTGYGYDVIEAANGREALRIAMPVINRISVVLTDVVMPFMGGAELAVRLRVLRPDLKFVFASGYASDPIPGPPKSSPGSAFLQKPFSPSALGRTVRKVIDAAAVA